MPVGEVGDDGMDCGMRCSTEILVAGDGSAGAEVGGSVVMDIAEYGGAAGAISVELRA